MPSGSQIGPNTIDPFYYPSHPFPQRRGDYTSVSLEAYFRNRAASYNNEAPPSLRFWTRRFHGSPPSEQMSSGSSNRSSEDADEQGSSYSQPSASSSSPQPQQQQENVAPPALEPNSQQQDNNEELPALQRTNRMVVNVPFGFFGSVWAATDGEFPSNSANYISTALHSYSGSANLPDFEGDTPADNK